MGAAGDVRRGAKNTRVVTKKEEEIAWSSVGEV
jgi:hypothetical protein